MSREEIEVVPLVRGVPMTRSGLLPRWDLAGSPWARTGFAPRSLSIPPCPGLPRTPEPSSGRPWVLFAAAAVLAVASRRRLARLCDRRLRR